MATLRNPQPPMQVERKGRSHEKAVVAGVTLGIALAGGRGSGWTKAEERVRHGRGLRGAAGRACVQAVPCALPACPGGVAVMISVWMESRPA